MRFLTTLALALPLVACTATAPTAPAAKTPAPLPRVPATAPLPASTSQGFVFVLHNRIHMEEAREEIHGTLSKLTPVQKFRLIVFSDNDQPDVLYPPDGSLASALPDNKRAAFELLRAARPTASEDTRLTPVVNAMRHAFAGHPQYVYFLSDGTLSPRAPRAIAELNVNHEPIRALAFVTITPEHEEILKYIAFENYGLYKFVPAKPPAPVAPSP